MSTTVDPRTGKLTFRKLIIDFKDQKRYVITSVLEWEWVDGKVSGKRVGNAPFSFGNSTNEIVKVKEVKEIVYEPKVVK